MAQWRVVERDGQRDLLGEGTYWCARDNALYWVDILAPGLNRLTLADDVVTSWPMPEPLGWIVADAQGGFIGGFQSGFARITLDPLMIAPMGDPEPHLPGNRMNDGKADRHGHIWCGTMDMAEERESGSLYRLAPNGSWLHMDGGYGVTNGPAFSPCGRWLYHADSPKRLIYRFAITEEGLSDKQDFIRFGEDDGFPDGMNCDADGGLWIAHWDGGRISRFTPDGMRDRFIALPAKRITNMAFAGDRLDRLFVSSAAIGLPDSDHDGALFEVDCGAIGQASHSYGG